MTDEPTSEPYPDDYDLMRDLERVDSKATDASKKVWMARQHGTENEEQMEQWLDAAENDLEWALRLLQNARSEG